jgi:hypothetical protein
MRFISFGDFGTNDLTRLTAAAMFSPAATDSVRGVGFSATVDNRCRNNCGSVSAHAPAPAATATQRTAPQSIQNVEFHVSTRCAPCAR